MRKQFLFLLLTGTILSGVQGVKATTWHVEPSEEIIKTGNENIFHVQEQSTLDNQGYLETESGNIFHMDTHPDYTINLSGSVVQNDGTMKTNGTGHAVYAYPIENQRSTTTVKNWGDMYRIELSETGKSAASFLGEGSSVFNYKGATLRGSVRLGTNATLENFGSMVNLANDDKENFTLANLVYFDKNGKFRNGFKETLLTDRIWVDLTPTASIKTDNIVFGQNGTLYNAGLIENETITAFDSRENEYQKGVKIYLMNNPYYETDEVVLDDEGNIDRTKSHLKYFVEKTKETNPDKVNTVVEKPILRTNVISLGDDATFRADQGSDITIYDTFTVAESGTINIGSDYYWKSNLYQDPVSLNTYNWDRDIIVDVEQPEEIEYEDEIEGTVVHRTKYIVGDTDPEARDLNAIPLRSTANISRIVTGNNAQITVRNTDLTMSNTFTDSDTGEQHVGGVFDVADNATLNVLGSSMHLVKDNSADESGKMTFAKNGTLNVEGYWQDEISYSDDNTKLMPDYDPPPCPSGMSCVKEDEYERSVVEEAPIASELRVDNDVTMGDNAQITLTGIETGDEYTRMGNRTEVVGEVVSVEVGSGNSDNRDLYEWQPDAAIYLGKNMVLGNNSTITFGGGHLRDTTARMFYDAYSSLGSDGVIYVQDIGDLEITLGDHSAIQTVDQTTNILIAKTITFGDFGTYKTSGPWDTPGGRRGSMIAWLKDKMFFENDGYFCGYSGLFHAKQLNMKDRAEVQVMNDLVTQTVVGSDSNVYIQPAVERGATNGITNGLFRQEGAENINLYSIALNLNTEEDKKRKPIYNENYLLNGVDVDDIYIQSGGLRLGPASAYQTDVTVEAAGDIHGTFHMASDTWVRFTGNDVKIYDPIERQKGATNTLVWIDVDDTTVIDTRNTIDSDTVMIGGGTLNVHHEVTAPKVILDDAGALRVYDTDLIQADVMEYETTAANTTLFITPRKNEMDSFGSVQLDRLVIENGTFNAYHPIVAAAGKNDVKTTTEGIWLGTGAAINAYNDVRTSQLIRRQDRPEGTITNTTARLMKGQLVVDRHVDIDNLILKSGTFEFRNTGNVEAADVERDMVVTNNVVVENGVNFLASGSSHPNSGKIIIGNGSGSLTVNKGARIALSNTNLAASDTAGQMNMMANLNLNAGSTLDLRTSDSGSDLIYTTGRANLENNLRLIVRNMNEGTPYRLIHADGGVNVPSDFQISFRWHDTDLSAADGQNLYLTVGHIATLKEELKKAGVSKNILNIGSYISDNWDGSYGPWDDIFYATSVGEAAKNVSEYVPDGYVAAPQVALRTTQSFQNVMAGELGDMRRLQPRGSQRTRIAPSLRDRSPVYRGRAGGDRYGERPIYQPYVRNKYQAYSPDYSGRSSMNIAKKGSYRSNKGGLWAKPFYATTTQDSDKGISGYDYNAYGLAAGLDHRFGRWTWGLAGVYARGDFKQDKGSIDADVDTLGVGIYGNFKPAQSGFFMDLFASYLHNGNKATHKIKAANTTLKANYDTNSLGAGVAFGYDFGLAQSLYLTPKIGFNFAHLTSDEVKEKGNAPLVMRVKNPDVNSIQLPVELRVAFPVAAKRFELLPELHVRYTHDFGDTEYHAKAYPNGSEKAIELDNVGSPENLFTVGGGMSYISGAHELSGYYDYDFGDGFTSHIFNVGYKFLF